MFVRNEDFYLTQYHLMHTMAGENFPSSMPHTKLNFLDQNLIPNNFWGQSGARKVCPQAVLGQPFYHVVSLTGPDLKLPGAMLSWPLIHPKNGLESGFDIRN